MARAPKAAKVVAFALIAGASLDKEMKSIVNAVGKLDDRIQLYLLSELAHIAEHKNPTRLNSFFEAMTGKGMRVVAINAFVQKFGTVKLDEEKGKFVIDNSKTFDLEAAKLVKWYSMKPEGKLQSFSLEDKVKALLQQAVNIAADEERKGKVEDKIDMSMVEALSKAIGFTPEVKADKAKAKTVEAAPVAQSA